MTQDEILRMAIDAGATNCANPDKWGILEISYENLERFAFLILSHTDPSHLMSFQQGFEIGRLSEREECAKVCDAEAEETTEGEWTGCAQYLANKIRARGEKWIEKK